MAPHLFKPSSHAIFHEKVVVNEEVISDTLVRREIMTTFMLSELGCNGSCQQGRLPCNCSAKELAVDKCDKCESKIYEEEGHACDNLEPVIVEFRN